MNVRIKVKPLGWYWVLGFSGFPCVIVPGKSLALFLKQGGKSKTRPSNLEATEYETLTPESEENTKNKETFILNVKRKFPKTPILRAKGIIY